MFSENCCISFPASQEDKYSYKIKKLNRDKNWLLFKAYHDIHLSYLL